MLPWAAELHQKRKDSLSKDDPEARCLPPGVPRMSTTPYPWTIVQTPQLIVIVYEGGAHIWRKIFMDGRGHDPNVEYTWLGDSIGHWEGDTLVVETVGQNDITWLDEGGTPHSADMKVTERIRRPDYGHLEIEHTIDDPKTFSKPWTFTTHPSLLTGELIEYICQENNKDVQHLFGKVEFPKIMPEPCPEDPRSLYYRLQDHGAGRHIGLAVNHGEDARCNRVPHKPAGRTRAAHP